MSLYLSQKMGVFMEGQSIRSDVKADTHGVRKNKNYSIGFPQFEQKGIPLIVII